MRFLRSRGHAGGLFKPAPHRIPLRGTVGKMLEARRITGLPLVTEIMDVRDLELLGDNIDILQVGAGMQNYSCWKSWENCISLLLKRGLSD